MVVVVVFIELAHAQDIATTLDPEHCHSAQISFVIFCDTAEASHSYSLLVNPWFSLGHHLPVCMQYNTGS